MIINTDQSYAALALRLAINGAHELSEAENIDWERLLRVSRSNRLLLRVADWLQARAVRPSPDFADAVLRERQRVEAQLELIDRIGGVCAERGIDFIFPKAFQHYPDSGSDIDMFVPSHSRGVDRLIVERFNAHPEKRGLYHRVGGTANYRIDGYGSTLEIHHGRLGRFGETDSYVSTLIENGTQIELGGKRFLSPSAEDNIVLHGMLRVYGRLYVRLSDIASTISLVRRGDLDWDYIVTTSRQFGSFHGLCSFLSFADQIHLEVFGNRLTDYDQRMRNISKGWGRVEFKDGFYRFPVVKTIGRIYFNKFKVALLSGDFASASRLTLLPLAAASTALRKIMRIVLG
ncbi:MAG TPA: nucleotidyltransferase family protein [Blastocatellia bacterium]|nr:nucleotidyltransferase family protein [Blastocatellia bacterium]